MPTFLNLGVLAVVLLTAALYLRWNGRRKEGGDCKLPLGYSFWSIIGDTYSLLKPQPSNSIGDLVVQRMSKYGKIFTLNLIGKPMIVSADPELNRFVLQNEMALFENIWPPAFRNLMGENSMALRTGDAHKQLRSIVISFISAARLRTSFLHEADWFATKLLSTWEDGSVISAVKAAKQYTFDVIVKNALSMEPGQPETEKLREDFSRLFIGVFYIVPLNLPGTQYNRSVKARHNFLRVIKQSMDQRMNVKGIAGAEEDDLLRWVMKNTRLSIEEIGDLVLGTVFAGSETTSKAIPLVIYFLEGCPRAIEQLRKEHLQIVRSRKQGGDSKLTWDDYKQMEFTQCVIMEALRLGNITRFLQKRATTDIQYKGQITGACEEEEVSSYIL